MKKTLLIIAAVLSFGVAQAQIPNPGFETINSLGMAANWRQQNFIIFPIDSTCTPLGLDSTAITTSDAHTGGHGLDIGVGTYCESSYSGEIQVYRYDFDTFADQRVPFTDRPANFTFYYKLFPVMGDKGSAQITLQGEDTHVIADGTMLFGTAAATWTLATVPLTYFSADTPAYITIRFTLHTDSAYHYGTRFQVDDINYYGTTGIESSTPENQKLHCYPIPAEGYLHIVIPANQYTGNAMLSLRDATGRLLKAENVSMAGNGRVGLNTSDLAKGLYFLQIIAGETITTGKFVK